MTKHKRPGARDDARSAEGKPEDVASLIAERRKIEEWIAALAAKRDQTPVHVFTRVQGDYDKRLAEITRRLSAHQGSLADEQAALRKKLAALDETIQQQKDERVEIELRAQVGELEGSEVDDAYRSADERLAKLTAERSEVEEDLQRVSDFFAAASGGKLAAPTESRANSAGFDELSFLKSVVGENRDRGTAAAPPPARPSVVSTPAISPKPAEPMPDHVTDDAKTAATIKERPATTPSASAPTSAPVAPIAPSDPRDSAPITGAAGAETAEASTASASRESQASHRTADSAPPRTSASQPATANQLPPQRTGERPAVPSPAAASADSEAKTANAGELSVEREEEPLVEKPAPRPARVTIAMQQASMTFEPEDASGVVKANESAPSLLDGIAPATGGADKPFAANVVSNNPLSLKSTAPKDIKTLKCRECGSMNDPTEWYCERCGAELSGL